MGWVLLADDREVSRELVAAELQDAGYRVMTALDGDEAWALFQRHPFDLVITDLRMPGSDGMALLRRIRSSESRHMRVPVIVMSAYGTLSVAAAAGRAGATDFLTMDDVGIQQVVEQAREILGDASPVVPEILQGRSPAIRRTRTQIQAVAPLHVPLLIAGPRGSGRDAVASLVHRSSPRRSEPFTVIASDTPPVPSAVPSAGSVYLDQVETFPESAQRFWSHQLQQSETRAEEAPVRVLAATSEDLISLAGAGRFDSRLARTLSRFVVQVPPLRQRIEDLPILVDAVLRSIRERLEIPCPHFTPAALSRLKTYDWPGNIRDLAHVLEAVTARSARGEVSADLVSTAISGLQGPLPSIAEERTESERALLLDLYRKHGSFTGVGREIGKSRNGAKYRFAIHNLLPVRGALAAEARGEDE